MKNLKTQRAKKYKNKENTLKEFQIIKETLLLDIKQYLINNGIPAVYNYIINKKEEKFLQRITIQTKPKTEIFIQKDDGSIWVGTYNNTPILTIQLADPDYKEKILQFIKSTPQIK